MIRRPPRSTLFPYTTLFRSKTNAAASLFPVSPTGVTGNVLLRLVNAGLRMHVPSIVGSLTTPPIVPTRSEEHTSELQSRLHLVCRLLLEKKNQDQRTPCIWC